MNMIKVLTKTRFLHNQKQQNKEFSLGLYRTRLKICRYKITSTAIYDKKNSTIKKSILTKPRLDNCYLNTPFANCLKHSLYLSTPQILCANVLNFNTNVLRSLNNKVLIF